MGSTLRPAFTKPGAALTGFMAFVVFTLATGATRHNWTIGLMVGAVVGVGVLVTHWFAAQFAAADRRC